MPRSIKNVIWRNGWPSFRCKINGEVVWIALGVQDEDGARDAAEALRKTVQLEKLRVRLEEGGVTSAVAGDARVLDRYPVLREKFKSVRQRSDVASLAEVELASLADAKGRDIKERSIRDYWFALKLIVRTVKKIEGTARVGNQKVGAFKVTILTEELAHDYEAACIEAAKDKGPDALSRAKATAASTLNQAQSIFSPAALKGAQMRALQLPDLTGFISFTPSGTTRRLRAPVDDTTLARLRSAMDDFWFSAPARWLALALCGNLGVRRGSAKLAQWSWVRRVQGQWRIYLLATDESAPKGNEYSVPIPDDLWADMCEVRQPGDYIVPGATIEERDAIFDANATWLRGLGLDVDKPNHELRAIYAQAMKRAHGADAARDALGHGDGRVTQIYTGTGTDKTVRPL